MDPFDMTDFASVGRLRNYSKLSRCPPPDVPVKNSNEQKGVRISVINLNQARLVYFTEL